MHQAVSMQWERMSNLWHTRKWKSLYLGPDWSPAPKFLNQTSCPTQPHHHNLVDGFQEAIDSNDISGIKLVLDQPILTGTTCTDFLKYNRTELTSLKITAEKIVASTIQPPPTTIYCPTTSAHPSTSNHWPEDIQDGNTYLEWWPLQLLFVALICSKSFDQSNCNSIAKTQLMCKPCPQTRRAPLSTSTAGKSLNPNGSTNLEI